MEKIYLVIRGKTPGIYFSPKEQAEQINGFPRYLSKGFNSVNKAIDWKRANDIDNVIKEEDIRKAFAERKKKTNAPILPAPKTGSPPTPITAEAPSVIPFRRVPLKIYTDGSVISPDNNAGGWACVAISDDKICLRLKGRKKAKKLESHQMELYAVHKTLKKMEKIGWNLNDACIYTDCQYIMQHYLKNIYPQDTGKKIWKKLWKRVTRYNITISWVKGHAGNPYNEECDRLAKEAATEQLALITAKKVDKKKTAVVG